MFNILGQSLMGNEKMQKSFREAVEEGLSILGESGKKAVLFHMEKRFRVGVQDLPRRTREFVNALRELFGSGSRYIEQAICMKLEEKMGLKFESLDLVSVAEKLMVNRERGNGSQ